MTFTRPTSCPLCRVDPDGRRWINAACHQHGMPSVNDDPLQGHELREFVDDATVDVLAAQRAGLPRNHPEQTPIRRAAVQHLTQAGNTTRQIAERLGVSPRTVTRHRQQGASR